MLNAVSPVFCVYTVVNMKTACEFSCLLINPIISKEKKKKWKKRRLFPKVLCMTFVSSVQCAVNTVTLTTLLSQS